MLTLGNLFLFMLLAAAGAWLWHSHGIRERALQAVRRHCDKLDVELLDGNVAFRKLTLLPDARGSGAASWIVAQLVRHARDLNLPSLSLVAVNGSTPFWTKQGFAAMAAENCDSKLASYGADAHLMRRLLS